MPVPVADVGDAEARKMEAREDDNAADDEDDETAAVAHQRTTRSTGARPLQTRSAPFTFIESGRTARKILSRIELLDDVRERVLRHPELDAKLTHAQQLTMPAWWAAGESDKLLLQNLVYHGLGKTGYVKKFDHAFYRGQTDAKLNKERRNFLREFLEDKQPLVARVKYICRLVLADAATALAEFQGLGRQMSKWATLQPRAFTRSLRSELEGVGANAAGLMSPDVSLMLSFSPFSCVCVCGSQ